MDELEKIAMAAFEDELEKLASAELEKLAGVGDYLIGGIKALGRLGGRTAAGGKIRPKALYRAGRLAYNKAGGGLAGAKAVLGSQAGQAATVAGLGGLAAHSVYRGATAPFRSNQRQGY